MHIMFLVLNDILTCVFFKCRFSPFLYYCTLRRIEGEWFNILTSNFHRAVNLTFLQGTNLNRVFSINIFPGIPGAGCMGIPDFTKSLIIHELIILMISLRHIP